VSGQNCSLTRGAARRAAPTTSPVPAGDPLPDLAPLTLGPVRTGGAIATGVLRPNVTVAIKIIVAEIPGLARLD
jgi:hypothetical protein